MQETPTKDSLKKILESLVGLGETIATLKNAITNNEEVAGGKMPKPEELKEKSEASEKEDAKAAAEADASAVAEAKAKAEAEAAEAKKKMEDEAEAKKADSGMNSAECSKTEETPKEEAKAAEVKPEITYASMTEEESAKAGFTETEKTLAMKYTYPEMTKMLASLSLELASIKDEVAKEKAEKTADSRFADITELGFALTGEKAVAQKKRYADMSESAFAAYKEELAAIKSTMKSSEPTLKEIVKAGKAQAGKMSFEVEIDKKKESLFDKFKKI